MILPTGPLEIIPPNFPPKQHKERKFLDKLLVKRPGYLPGVCGWDLRLTYLHQWLICMVNVYIYMPYMDPMGCFDWLIRILRSLTVDDSEIRRENSPVEVKVAYLPLFTRFWQTSQVVGNGISEPSTVVHENKPNPKRKASPPKHHFSGAFAVKRQGVISPQFTPLFLVIYRAYNGYPPQN